MSTYAATFDDVQSAAERIRPFAHRTPVMTSRTLDELAGRNLFFKCENLQKIGAFKFRGACNAIFHLDAEEARKGVVTHSSGNHAQGIALAAKLRGIPAHIVMPEGTSHVKRTAVEGYGAHVYTSANTQAAREGMMSDVQRETGAMLIPPYNHPDIIAGQGTAALELLQIEPDLNAIIAPIGGGGLLAGTSIAARGINPSIMILGAEPAGADDAARSLRSGERQPPPDPPKTICDGLRTGLGELTWAIIRDNVADIIVVSDEEVVRAMRLVWERMKLIIEPSSATVVAALLRDEVKARPAMKRVGVILSGGNVDLDALPW